MRDAREDGPCPFRGRGVQVFVDRLAVFGLEVRLVDWIGEADFDADLVGTEEWLRDGWWLAIMFRIHGRRGLGFDDGEESES